MHRSSVFSCQWFAIQTFVRTALSPIAIPKTRKRFEELRQYLHFNDNDAMVPTPVRLDTICCTRPLITLWICADASSFMCRRTEMCATKMGGNPSPANICPQMRKQIICAVRLQKVLIHVWDLLSGTSAIVISENAPDLGASSNVVIRLSDRNVRTMSIAFCISTHFYTSSGCVDVSETT